NVLAAAGGERDVGGRDAIDQGAYGDVPVPGTGIANKNGGRRHTVQLAIRQSETQWRRRRHIGSSEVDILANGIWLERNTRRGTDAGGSTNRHRVADQHHGAGARA